MLFEHAEKFGLHLGLHLRDFVKQEAPTVSALEKSFTTEARAGKRATFMTE